MIQDENGNLCIDRFEKYKYLPIKIIVSYLLFTIILYTIGVFEWKTYSPVLFYSLQGLYIVALGSGYYIGINSKKRKLVVWNEKFNTKLITIIIPILLIDIFILLINMFREYGYGNFDFIGLFNDIKFGLGNMGAGYEARYQQQLEGGSRVIGGSLFSAFNIIWGFLELNVILLSIIYFKKFKKWQKVLASICCFEIVIFFVSVGTNIGVFRIVLGILVFFVFRVMQQHLKNYDKSKSFFRKIIPIVSIAIIISVVYFVSTMRSRGGILYWEQSDYNVGGVGLNRESILFKIFPEFMYIPLISLSSYLTQGYYGFALSLEVPWTPMFGAGCSLQFVDQISELFVDIGKYTYQYKIEQQFGWDSRIQWASAYTWIANDVGHWGVIIILFAIGYLFAITYRESVCSENPFSKMMFYYLLITCIFLPCNFQIIQSLYTLAAFIFCFVAWLLTTKRIKIGKIK
jgi:hypothetical protein